MKWSEKTRRLDEKCFKSVWTLDQVHVRVLSERKIMREFFHPMKPSLRSRARTSGKTGSWLCLLLNIMYPFWAIGCPLDTHQADGLLSTGVPSNDVHRLSVHGVRHNVNVLTLAATSKPCRGADHLVSQE